MHFNLFTLGDDGHMQSWRNRDSYKSTANILPAFLSDSRSGGLRRPWFRLFDYIDVSGRVALPIGQLQNCRRNVRDLKIAE